MAATVPIASPVGRLLSSATATTLRGNATSLRSKLNSVDDLFDLISSSCTLARVAPGTTVSETQQQQLSTIETTLDSARSASNAVQAGCGIVQLLTGGLFFKTNPDGSFQLDPVSQQRTLLSPLSLLSKVTRLASKVLGTVKFMGSQAFPVYQLGAHATGFGLSASAFGTVSSAFDVAENSREVLGNLKQNKPTEGTSKENGFMARLKRARASMFNLLCSIFDLLAQAFCFISDAVSTAFMGVHTAFIVGIFCFLSALGNVILSFAF
ncbi:hypothetical protein [Chlamydia trachomatis]|uniref:hypothetical protein n=1 Tax=Chlamydia trachomatis TaxID=813 RepID=UPI0001B46E17|nr:hypothetical protein [Chlamydia trachomatis]AGR94052.1 hypothetical protein CTRC69_03275 [Chlamydia trachomatis RC-F/69]AGR95898.1 hypothetical protein CTRC852_03310 [Chlamydia trachomatis RC-F(s)/852]AGR99617.1 hypothetical protein CTRC342_03300 [Chlamydia trachomatis RC-F(s)/342]